VTKSRAIRHSAGSVVPIDAGSHRERVRAERDALVAEHLDLVASIARGVATMLPPSFDLDDLIAEGNWALLRAAARYRPAEHGGAPFSAYARQIVRGAILDSVSGSNWVEGTRPGLEQTGRNSADPEGVDSVVPISEHDRASTEPTIETAIDLRRRVKRVSDAISWLPADQRRILEEYYSPWGPTQAEVAARLGLTRRKVGILHDAALAALRARLKAA
jgi:RNA polymerase sigma factor (sigma-70 family)